MSDGSSENRVKVDVVSWLSESVLGEGEGDRDSSSDIVIWLDTETQQQGLEESTEQLIMFLKRWNLQRMEVKRQR